MAHEDIRWKENDDTHDFRIEDTALIEYGQAQMRLPDIILAPVVVKIAVQDSDGPVMGVLMVVGVDKDGNRQPEIGYAMSLEQLTSLAKLMGQAVEAARE